MAKAQIRFTVPEQLHEELMNMADWLALGNANEVGRHLMLVAYQSMQTARAMRDQTDVVQAMVDAIQRAEAKEANEERQNGKQLDLRGELAHL